MSSRSDARPTRGSAARIGGAVLLAAMTGAHPLAARPAEGAPAARTEHVLRVCADPNNMPFSNRAGEGFENRIAELIARDLGDSVTYAWWPPRRGWVRNTLRAGTCDVAIGVPSGYDLVETTRPYYRSTYVFVSRADRHLALGSLDDPRLRAWKIGLHFIGDDYTNPPPAHALGERGIVRNVVGYSIYGDYREPNTPARLIDAVAKGDVDIAIAWGPLAGYFAKHEPVPLAVAPVRPMRDARSGMVFAFPIALGVRKGDAARRDTLQRVLDRERPAIARILAEYGVPVVGAEAGS
jgi:quinoprotein dehydrogenase-associated probable ABC transporter substrate-binding protein